MLTNEASEVHLSCPAAPASTRCRLRWPSCETESTDWPKRNAAFDARRQDRPHFAEATNAKFAATNAKIGALAEATNGKFDATNAAIDASPS